MVTGCGGLCRLPHLRRRDIAGRCDVDEAIKFVKNTLDYCNLRKILILSQNWKAWLRSRAFNTCRDGALARRVGSPKLSNLEAKIKEFTYSQ